MQALVDLRRSAQRCLQPLIRNAAQRYIAGVDLPAALAAVERLATQGYRATLGFWDGTDDKPRGVQRHYLDDLAALAGRQWDCYESIKLPALRDEPELLDEVVSLARDANIRLHFDSHATDQADATWQAARQARARGARVSCSLPGRWLRSQADAEVAIAEGIGLRIIKGQWADPEAPTLDLRAGVQELVELTAGRAAYVAIATHDRELGRSAVRLMQAAGTPCEWELLFGLPSRSILPAARELGVAVRWYVPYGHAYLPYCLSQARRNPRLLGQLVLDACRGVCMGPAI